MMSFALSTCGDSDHTLARAAASGISTGIGDLYQRHYRRVYSVCLRMTGNSTEAEDLTQEVFIQLLRKVGSFRGESQFTTWLYRLTVNHVLMHFRRANYRLEQIPGEIDRATPKARSHSVDMDRIALNAAVAQLPAGCRAVFLKFDVEGYNHGEIAGIFGYSVGNSKSQLHKARKKLRRLLNQTRRSARGVQKIRV